MAIGGEIIPLVVAVAILFMINKKYLSYKTAYVIDAAFLIFKKDVVECNFRDVGGGNQHRCTLQVDKTIFPFGGVRYKRRAYRIFPDCGTRVDGLMSYDWIRGFCDPIDKNHPKYPYEEEGYIEYMKPTVYVDPEGVKPSKTPRRSKKDTNKLTHKAFMSPWLEYKPERVFPATPMTDEELAIGYDSHVFEEYMKAGQVEDIWNWVIVGVSGLAAGLTAIALLKLMEITEILTQILGKL